MYSWNLKINPMFYQIFSSLTLLHVFCIAALSLMAAFKLFTSRKEKQRFYIIALMFGILGVICGGAGLAIFFKKVLPIMQESSLNQESLSWFWSDLVLLFLNNFQAVCLLIFTEAICVVILVASALEIFRKG